MPVVSGDTGSGGGLSDRTQNNNRYDSADSIFDEERDFEQNIFLDVSIRSNTVDNSIPEFEKLLQNTIQLSDLNFLL